MCKSPLPLGADVRASADQNGPLELSVESAGLHQLVPGLEHVVPILQMVPCTDPNTLYSQIRFMVPPTAVLSNNNRVNKRIEPLTDQFF